MCFYLYLIYALGRGCITRSIFPNRDLTFKYMVHGRLTCSFLKGSWDGLVLYIDAEKDNAHLCNF